MRARGEERGGEEERKERQEVSCASQTTFRLSIRGRTRWNVICGRCSASLKTIDLHLASFSFQTKFWIALNLKKIDSRWQDSMTFIVSFPPLDLLFSDAACALHSSEYSLLSYDFFNYVSTNIKDSLFITVIFYNLIDEIY